MKFSLRLFLLAVVLLGVMMGAPISRAASPNIVIVRWGDTLAGIAARTGTTVQSLVRANGLPNANFIYAGQRLVVPGTVAAPIALPSTSSIYTVNAGDTLATVAAKFGTTPTEVLRVNGLRNPNFIYIGQRLNIPGRVALPAPQAPSAPTNPPPANPARLAPTAGKWIDIDLSEQRTTAYQGTTPLKSVLVSTGLTWTPTPIGRFAIYTKLASQAMSGPGYYLPGVPWVMYFTGAYAIHGTYWHHNFGRPMSHGCVNLTIDDAKWFYDWAEIGTPVVVHP